jgi:hypothetical protein
MPTAVTAGVLRHVRPVRRRWRRATTRLRVLPDFVIVGAQKAGTTSLYAYLAALPDVLPAASKEVHFFDTCTWSAGPTAYRANFPFKAHLWLASRLRRRRVITGEATPYYLYHPVVAERLAATAPHAKIVILLRDPVERTLSHYWHEVRGGRESLPLEEALQAEQARLRGRAAALVGGKSPCENVEHRNFSYQDRSRYAPQVSRYLELFGASQVLVLRSEDLFRDDPRVKARLADFLDLPELTRPFVAENVGHRSKGDPEETVVRERLGKEFAADQEALTALVGDRFDRGLREYANPPPR